MQRIRRQFIYREICPTDGDILTMHPETPGYDVTQLKAGITKVSWVEPAPGWRAQLIDMWATAGYLTVLTVKAMFAGIGFMFGLAGIAHLIGVPL